MLSSSAPGANPKRDFLGIDVYEPGIGRLLGRLHALGLDNVRVIREDAALAMGHFPAGSLAAVLMFFPDPWPKKRHHKRRLVQPGFAAAVARALAVGAEWSLATDCEDVRVAHAGGARRVCGSGRMSPAGAAFRRARPSALRPSSSAAVKRSGIRCVICATGAAKGARKNSARVRVADPSRLAALRRRLH